MDTGQADIVARAIIGLHDTLLLVLICFAVHRLWLVAGWWRLRRNTATPPPALADGDSFPTVTIQLPLYNEPAVAGRLVDAVARMDYPRDRFDIQIVDDSTDDTSAYAARAAERWRQGGVQVAHIRRSDRAGFKAGALAHGLVQSRAEFVAVFDADFVPSPDFLRRMMPSFADDRTGMVQARWGHLNRGASFLTRVQALFLDAHFGVEHAARAHAGRFFNFNGTAGVWRRAAIDDAGGWQHDTLTEDLDLSLRAQLRGWRFVYRDDVESPAELPSSMAAYRSQQHRWAKGAMETARKMLAAVWRAPLPLATKLDATAVLLGNAAYLALLALCAVTPAAFFAREWTGLGGWPFVQVLALVPASVSFALFLAAAARSRGESWGRIAWLVPAAVAWGIGMCLNNGLAALEGAVGHRTAFVRTPKTGETGHGAPRPHAAATKRLARLLLPVAEACLALTFLFMAGTAYYNAVPAAIPFSLVFAAGFGLAAWTSLAGAPRPAASIKPACDGEPSPRGAS